MSDIRQTFNNNIGDNLTFEDKYKSILVAQEEFWK